MDGMVLVGIAAVILAAAYAVHKYANSEVKNRVSRSLQMAQQELVANESNLEYYQAMVPMLRKRVARLQKLEQATVKARKEAAEKTDRTIPGLG